MAQNPGEAFDRLVSLVARLRAPDGCPWDRAQTLESLRAFVLEEAYEVLEAIDRGDRPALREEIGDFIFEGVLLAQLCEEGGDFTVADSLTSIADKLVRRHPHVFGSAERARTADEVLGRWEEAKARERAAETSKDAASKTILGGVPRSLPALLRAYQMSTRAAAVGFDWDRAADVLDKIDEEVAELREAVQGRYASGGARVAEGGKAAGGLNRIEEEMGDLLFALANLARKLGVEPEAALRRADDKFARRFTTNRAPVRLARRVAQGRGARADGGGVGADQGRGIRIPARVRLARGQEFVHADEAVAAGREGVEQLAEAVVHLVAAPRAGADVHQQQEAVQAARPLAVEDAVEDCLRRDEVRSASPV